MTDQLSLFVSDGAEPAVDDLTGLLFGPGHVVRNGDAARVSVLVPEVWRAEALLGEFERRGLGGEFKVSRDDSTMLVVRTEFTEILAPLARRWTSKGPSADRLSGGALRLWTIAAGEPADNSYSLRLPVTDETRWPKAGAALAHVGLPAVLLGPRGGGPAYRITSAKRLAKLRMLVGDRPPGAPVYSWP